MAAPYIPAPDAAFSAWLSNFATLIAATPAAYGLLAGDATAISTQDALFQPAYTLAIDPPTRTSATIADKDAARATAEATCRPYAIRIRNNAAVSDLLKVGVGVTVPVLVPSPIPAPTSAPVLGLTSAAPLLHTLTYKDTGSSGKNKPFGAIGVEIWRSIGTVVATDPAQCAFNGSVTKSPFHQHFVDANRGKVCTYFARFVTRSGPAGQTQVGPWSASLVSYVI